jgi:hypothetical protein
MTVAGKSGKRIAVRQGADRVLSGADHQSRCLNEITADSGTDRRCLRLFLSARSKTVVPILQ